MNEQIQVWLFEQLQKVSTGVDKAVEFASGELPLFVQEFLMFAAVYYWFLIVISTACLIIGPIVAWKLFHKTDGFSIVIGGLPTLIGFFTFASNIKSALLVTFAPRVFLLTSFLAFFK